MGTRHFTLYPRLVQDGYTALHFAARDGDKVLATLLDRGASIDVQDTVGGLRYTL